MCVKEFHFNYIPQVLWVCTRLHLPLLLCSVRMLAWRPMSQIIRWTCPASTQEWLLKQWAIKAQLHQTLKIGWLIGNLPWYMPMLWPKQEKHLPPVWQMMILCNVPISTSMDCYWWHTLPFSQLFGRNVHRWASCVWEPCDDVVQIASTCNQV